MKKWILYAILGEVHRVIAMLKLLGRDVRRLQEPSFHFTVGLIEPKHKDQPMPVDVKLTTEQRVQVSVQPKTKAGKPADVDGDVAFTSDNPAVVIERIDPKSAWINSPDSPGDSVIVVSADADLDATGVQTIEDTVTIHVSNPLAESLGLTLGNPEDKPTPSV